MGEILKNHFHKKGSPTIFKTLEVIRVWQKFKVKERKTKKKCFPFPHLKVLTRYSSVVVITWADDPQQNNTCKMIWLALFVIQ